MTDYQDALVLENLDLVNWVIRTRISIPNRPLLTYDDFYAIGCEAICRAALKYQPDMGAFAPFACRYIYNAIVDHCRAMNYRLERSVEISEDENASLLDMLTCTSVDFDETVTDATAMSALAACKEKYNGVARKGVEAIELKLKGYNHVFLPQINRAEEFVELFENSIEHMSETRVDKDEVCKQFRIRGWSEETRQVILAALEYYKCAEGLAKIRG